MSHTQTDTFTCVNLSCSSIYKYLRKLCIDSDEVWWMAAKEEIISFCDKTKTQGHKVM